MATTTLTGPGDVARYEAAREAALESLRVEYWTTKPGVAGLFWRARVTRDREPVAQCAGYTAREAVTDARGFASRTLQDEGETIAAALLLDVYALPSVEIDNPNAAEG